MKKILFILAILPMFLFVSCSSDEEGEAREKYLSEIIVKEHKYSFGSADTYGELYENYTYDSEGNLIKKKTNHYNSTVNSRVSREYTYKYDEKKRLVEKCDYMHFALQKKYTYAYNNIDSISEMKVYDDDGDLDETWTYEYDDLKRLSKATVSRKWVGRISGYIHNYSYSEYKVTDTTYDLEDGTLFGITVDEYDSHGNLMSNKWTNGDTGREVQQVGISYEYNPDGKISKQTSWSMLPEYLTYKDYSYDKDGKLQKIHVSYSYKTEESDLIYEYIYI